MTAPQTREVTQLLEAWARGDSSVTSVIFERLYGDLRRIAQRHLRGESDEVVLQPTVLVHELYLRLVREETLACEGRVHFLSIAARVIRRVLVDHGRASRAQKRGGQWNRTRVESLDLDVTGPTLDILALDEALERLRELHTRQARVVELRFFGGAGVGETAELIGISPRTVEMDWRVARAWLRRQLADRMTHLRDDSPEGE